MYPIIKKIEYNVIKKKLDKLNIPKGKLVSIIYYDFEKEQIRLQQFTGFCTQFKPKGINTKLSVRNSFTSILSIEQQFFVHNSAVLNVLIDAK